MKVLFIELLDIVWRSGGNIITFSNLRYNRNHGSGLCFGLCYPSPSVVTSALCLVIKEYCVGQHKGETFAIVLHRFTHDREGNPTTNTLDI